MLRNITAVIFAVITLVNKLPSLVEILNRKILKFGETLASKVVGNPELSLEWLGKCRDLTGIKSERHLKEKVQPIVKTMDMQSFFSYISNHYHKRTSCISNSWSYCNIPSSS
tara:strand:+ start:5938 stop:6273 length:336 start_codon:yes stop_codon:yes gene_type:complete